MPSIIPEINTSTRRSSLSAAISSSLADNPNATPNTFSFSPSNNSSNSVAGLYGDLSEPLHPTTRTLQRHIMERTISEILFDLEYALKRKEEYRDKCKTLYSRIQKLEDEVENLRSCNSVLRVDKEFEQKQWEEIKNLKIDYIDLHQRYERLYAKYVLVNDEITLSDLV